MFTGYKTAPKFNEFLMYFEFIIVYENNGKLAKKVVTVIKEVNGY